MRHLILILFSAISTVSIAQWDHIPSGNNFTLGFVKIHEASGTCIAGGTNFLKSIDNGLTWSTITSPTFVNIYSVKAAAIVSPTSYILSENNNGYYKIWRTTNGGSSWTSYTQFNGIINDIAYNGSVLLAVGNGSLIRKSVDNGATWTTVSSPIYTNYKTVEWDAGTNTWVLGGEIRRVTSTSSNPTSFTATTLPYTISDLSYNNGHLVETRTFTNNTQSVVVYDNAGMEISETPSNSILIRDAFCISANKLVSNNYYNFYEIQPDVNNVYQYVDTLISNSTTSGVQINSMDFCSTYGLAVGASGGIARYDMNATPDLLLPATFNFNTTAPCAGTPVIATPEYSGGDSFQWYLDGVAISTNDTLFFNQPANGNIHDVTLELTYGGNTTSNTQQIISTPPPAFPNNYTVNVDTTLCYLDQAIFYFTGVTTSPSENYKVRLLRNGVVISDTINFNWGINSIPGPALSEDDTIQLQLFKTISCGTFYQTTDYHFHVGPDLNTFQLVSADSGVCNLDSQLHFALTNTVPGANYSLNFHTSGFSAYHMNFDTFTGAGTDTLDFSYIASNFYDVNLFHSPTEYEYPNNPEYISLNASYNGCSISSVPVFDIDLLYTDAAFRLRNESYLPGDTIKMSQIYYCEQYTWDISPSVPVMDNLHDSIPTFVPSAPGLYLIQQTVESRLGCIDTLTQRVIVADQLADTSDQVCYAAKLPAMAVLGSKVSSKGNYYDFGYFNYCCNYKTGFALRKLDSNGNLLWEKNNAGGYTGETLICAMDIDANENTYAIMYISDPYFHYELIDYSNSINGATYLVKWDSLGNMISAKNMGWKRVHYDLLIHNDRVLLSGPGGLASYDMNFNFVTSSPIPGFNLDYGISYGSNESAINMWYWNPNVLKLEKLANGKVAVVGWSGNNYSTTFGTTTLSPSFPCTGSTCSEYTFVAIYDLDLGFTNAAKVFETELGTMVDDVCSDNESNIYLLTNCFYNAGNQEYPDVYKTIFYDSIIQTNKKLQLKKSFLAKITSDLEPVWIKETSTVRGSVSCAKANEELVLSGMVYSDFYIGSGNTFMRMKGKNQDSIPYEPIAPYIGTNQVIAPHEPFLVRLDLDGNPVSGKMIGKAGFGDRYTFTSRTWNTVSPCGDIYISHQDRFVNGFNTTPYTYNPSQNQLEINGQSYLADSTLVFKFSATAACQDECTFFQFNPNDIQGSCNTDTVGIPVNFVYGVDSVSYDLFANGSVVESGYLQFDGFNLVLPLPGNFTAYSVVLHPANQTSDTIQVNGISQPVVPILQGDYAVACGDELQLFVSNSVFSSSAWTHNQGVVDSNFTTTYTLSDFTIGDTVTYSVNTVDQNGCSASTPFNIVYCYDLGLEEFSGSGFLLFPNPSSDVVYLVSENGNLNGLTLDILDTRGNLMASYQAEEVKAGIPIQQLSDGFYFLRIQSDGALHTIPFTKK